jgi:hypothetical protein
VPGLLHVGVIAALILAGRIAHAVEIAVETIDGTDVRGVYGGIDDGGALRVEHGPEVQRIRLDELGRIVFGAARGASPPEVGDQVQERRPPGDHQSDTRGVSGTPAPDAAVFYLRPQGQCAGQIVAEADGGIEVRTGFAESAILKFEHLAAIRIGAGDDGGRAGEVFGAELANRLAGTDVLIVRSGEQVKTVRGSLVALGPHGGRFLFQDRERSFEVARIYGIVLAVGAGHSGELQIANSESMGGGRPLAIVELGDGSQLPGWLQPAGSEQLTLETAFGSRLELQPDRIVAVVFHSDRVVYLSDMAAVRQETKGLLHAPWPIQKDRSVGGKPMRLGGRRFDKGLGVHARTQLVYALDGQFERFCATIGIDDSVRPRGNVVFRASGDDNVLFDSGPVGGSDEPQEIRLDVQGVSELMLLVDYGEQMDLADHADWAAARVIRAAK